MCRVHIYICVCVCTSDCVCVCGVSSFVRVRVCVCVWCVSSFVRVCVLEHRVSWYPCPVWVGTPGYLCLLF